MGWGSVRQIKRESMTMRENSVKGQELQASPSEIRAFIEYITQGWADIDGNPMIELRCIGPSKSVNVARFALDWIDDAVQHAEAMNKAKHNIYMCINPVDGDADIGPNNGAKDADILAATFCFADADDEQGMKNILSFAGPKFTASVKTGTTPFTRGHAYWILEEPVYNLDAWRDVQRSIAHSLQTDEVVINPSRIMRVAGTVSWPDAKKQAKGYVPELVAMRTEFSDDRDPVPFERMMRAFPPVKGVTTAASSDTISGFQIDIGQQAMDRAMVEQAIVGGADWHNNIIKLVASYVGKGLTDSEIHALTDRFTMDGYTVDDTRREVQQAINGARAKGWTPEPQVSAQDAIRAATEVPKHQDDNSGDVDIDGIDFDGPSRMIQPSKQPKPIFWASDAKPVLSSSYLVKGWLGAGQMSVVYGPSNVGKSFFVLDMAYHIAASQEWQGCRVNGGPVLFLATEGGNLFRNRVYALGQKYKFEDVKLAIRPSPVDLLRPEVDMQELAALCNEIEESHGRIAMIVIDTLSRAMAGGNENGPEDMTAFINNVDALRDHTGAHMLVVHHTGKDAAQGARGHSSLRAATDTEIELETTDDGIKTATATKQRDLQPKSPINFVLKSMELGSDADGDPVTTATIEIADEIAVQEAKQQKPRGRNQKALITAFKQMRDDGIGMPNYGGTGFPEPRTYWMIDAKDFEEFAKGKLSGTNTHTPFRQAFEALQGMGYMCQNDGYVWISAKEGRISK